MLYFEESNLYIHTVDVEKSLKTPDLSRNEININLEQAYTVFARVLTELIRFANTFHM